MFSTDLQAQQMLVAQRQQELRELARLEAQLPSGPSRLHHLWNWLFTPDPKPSSPQRSLS